MGARFVIAFVGPIGCGKTTAANYLIETFGFHRLRFAGPLKAMLRALGLSEAEVDGDLKQAPCALLGYKTPRLAMQTLGTEWGREMITADLWVRAWRKAFDELHAGVNVVIDDMRFPNEADAVRAATSLHKIVRIERPDLSLPGAAHVSELHTIAANRTIVNDGSPGDLYQKIDKVTRYGRMTTAT
jgi:hypothetical protein